MGIDSLTQQNMQNAGLAGIDRLASNAMFPQSQMDKTQYSVSSQLPTGAQTIDADYDTPTNAYTGLSTQNFAQGGITNLRYNGEEDGSQVQAWDPASGQVKLQQLNPQDLSVSKTADYTIPKDDIQTFIPDTDTETGLPLGSGSYILNSGSKMRVDSTGTVIDATPGRDEYTLNDKGYYQPTGSGLTWDGSSGMLTKKIGGVDVQVPGMYTKGGYQNEQGGLRLDQYGVPIPLPPAQYDSGAGKSGMSDAAPFIAAAAMMAATGMPTGFEGMVPASETLLGGFGAGTAAMGPTYSELGYSPDVFGGLAGTGGSAEGLTAAEQAAQISGTTGSVGPTYAELGYQGANAKSTADAIAAADAASKAANGGISAKQAMNLYRGANMLSSAFGGGSSQAGGYSAPQASAPPTIPTINRHGVTGYEGSANTPSLNLSPITLSKIKGVPGEQTFNAGGPTGGIANLGYYSDGGQLLKGPGDGMSDNIPAKIGQSQPARLADGEFVIPADVVSHLGNGSTDAGAKQLYAMMDKIRKARTGTKKQGKRINPSKFLL